MLIKLKTMLVSLDEDIKHMELSDHAYTKAYTSLLKKRRVIKSAIRKIERIEKGVA